MKHLILPILVLALCQQVQPQEVTYGRPSDLKGLTKLFVDTGGDLKNRERIMRELEKSKLGFTLLDSSEGAEVILNFGGGSEERIGNVVTNNAISTPIYKKIPTGEGRVYVVADGRLKVVMSFADEKSSGWEREPATNFGRDFVKLYKKANK